MINKSTNHVSITSFGEAKKLSRNPRGLTRVSWKSSLEPGDAGLCAESTKRGISIGRLLTVVETTNMLRKKKRSGFLEPSLWFLITELASFLAFTETFYNHIQETSMTPGQKIHHTVCHSINFPPGASFLPWKRKGGPKLCGFVFTHL
jgi:hypothetical protein